MKITDEQHKKNREDRAALVSLLEHPGWTVLKAHMRELATERAQGATQIGLDPVRRAEHVHGYHDAAAFPTWPAKRIEQLDAEIARYTQGR